MRFPLRCSRWSGKPRTSTIPPAVPYTPLKGNEVNVIELAADQPSALRHVNTPIGGESYHWQFITVDRVSKNLLIAIIIWTFAYRTGMLWLVRMPFHPLPRATHRLISLPLAVMPS